jgi:hypothetical protein
MPSLVRSFLVVVCLGVASAAHAGTIVPNPVTIANTAAVPLAVVTLVGTTTGMPAGGIVFNGFPASSDLTLLLTVQNVWPASPTFSQIGVLGDPLWSSVGWIPGAGSNWTMGNFSTGSAALGQSAAIPTGGVTDVFFITVPGIDVGEVLNVVFWNGLPGPPGPTTGSAPVTWVPEPGTLALLTGGLALLARARRRTLRTIASAIVAAVALATAANASLTPNPIDAVQSGNVTARFWLVGTTSGLPAGGLLLDGSIAPSDTTLLFQMEYLAAAPLAFSQMGIFRDATLFSGVGTVPGAGVDWTMAAVTTGGAFAAFAQSAALAQSAITDVLFVSSASFDVGETLHFAYSGPGGTVGGSGDAQWVPEPDTFALLAVGLALLARARRR